ncbi:MAG: RAD55 family ATPase [Candidatus Hodarchaeota archaeon]
MGKRMVEKKQLNSTKHPSKRSIGSKDVDNLIGGGIPRDRAVLVVGGPGTGKTTLGVQFLLQGAVHGEHGLHIVLEENPQTLMRRFNFLEIPGKKNIKYHNLLKSGKIKILDLLSARIGYREEVDTSMNIIIPPIFRLGDLLGVIYDLVRDYDIKRIVIDSLQSFFLMAEREVVQLREVLLAIMEPYRRVGIGLLITAERSPMNEGDSYQFIDHVFDGVIALNKGLPNKPNIRSLRIEKAIWTAHDLRSHQFKISNSGIEIVGPIETDHST